ncbi:MAG: PAS domain-containing protein [Deltaproteobacteria bacterium]|nr:PAS domain-containing protein [Deltaproteobacteria bacterium]
MTIPDTNITLETLLDQILLDVQFVDTDGFLRYLNKTAAARPANCKREIGVNIRDCHAKAESLQMVERIMKDFKQGRKEPHYYVSQTGRVAIKVRVFDADGSFIGIMAYSYPAGFPNPERTF